MREFELLKTSVIYVRILKGPSSIFGRQYLSFSSKIVDLKSWHNTGEQRGSNPDTGIQSCCNKWPLTLQIVDTKTRLGAPVAQKLINPLQMDFYECILITYHKLVGKFWMLTVSADKIVPL